jgi:3',5'-cyclic-nucleotide phosphodiesterase
MSKAFELVVLGCTGGPRENNLSGYLLSPMGSDEWITLDAGSLLGGIDLALKKNSLKSVNFEDKFLSKAGEMLIKHVRNYLISHAHLDHILGLVLNSQIDSKKCILGIDPTIDNIRDHIFNGRIWPNYGNEGVEPVLGLYTYVRLPVHQAQNIPNTSMTVEPYILCHPRGYPSTAFLIECKKKYLLYVGDTSSDFLEIEKHLGRIWRRIGPLIREKKLHAILLECSFSKQEADQVIFGHLDSTLMLNELRTLAKIADVPLNGLNVIVTHRKESLRKDLDAETAIETELLNENDLGINFIFPSQGACYIL